MQAASTRQAIRAFISISKLSPTFTRFGHSYRVVFSTAADFQSHPYHSTTFGLRCDIRLRRHYFHELLPSITVPTHSNDPQNDRQNHLLLAVLTEVLADSKIGLFCETGGRLMLLCVYHFFLLLPQCYCASHSSY